jgi:hypothetical protein
MPQQEEGKIRVMGRVARRVMGREARKFLRVEEAMGMAMGAEGMEMGKTGEDSVTVGRVSTARLLGMCGNHG